MKKVLITGSSGMLGSYVCNFIDKSKYQIICPNRDKLDLKNIQNIAQTIRDIKPDMILHFAAETNVDLCEVDVRHAYLVNVTATDVIAKTAKEIGAWTVYISTSNVFGFQKQLFYNELDLPNPTNYYGKSKLAGERAVQQHLPTNSLIIRSGWMVGGGVSRDHKFVGKIIEQIKKGAQTLRAVNDKYGTVTFASSLAAFIVKSMDQERVGLCHFASQGLVTRFDIAKMVAEFSGFKGVIKHASSSEFPLSAPRPESEGIVSVVLSAEDGPGLLVDDMKQYVSQFDIIK
jgi:dTDP-4-dehydrorhamnose reductase